jgi:mono/diheme cytochrome c family protein
MTRTRCISLAILALAPAAFLRAESKEDRGKYLVDNVMLCGDCHTPRTAEGKPDAARYLKGSTLNFQPIEPVPGWHKTAPDLTSGSRLFLKWKEEGLARFLETGLGPSGHAADPPMPTYKLKAEDAEAVVAYLKSLK